ncbi:hypothetical protein Ga0609869_001846 [Rhodovulum iodosum]|uniref:Uncharacterized protein n=1 Tax=Rhodovulum iodosum TaxID=68291 RepID=A0ABV3XT49_9RHOB
MTWLRSGCDPAGQTDVRLEVINKRAKSALVAKSLQKTKKAIPEDRHFCFTTKWLIGSGGRIRTYDQLINSQLLYH